jgi:hypothetical protein
MHNTFQAATNLIKTLQPGSTGGDGRTRTQQRQSFGQSYRPLTPEEADKLESMISLRTPCESGQTASLLNRSTMGIHPANIALYLASLARIKPLGKATETDTTLSSFSTSLKVDAADLSEGAFALAIRLHRRAESDFFPGYGTLLSDIKTAHRLLISYAEKQRKASAPQAIPDYTAESFPQWLKDILAEMNDPKHGLLFKNSIPPKEWLVHYRPVWERVLVRDRKLWFLSLKDFALFKNTMSLLKGASMAGYEVQCRELPDWVFANGKRPEHYKLDPLHIIPEWILNNEINNERKTA